ncbi:hypothetical protein [Rhodococcus sp. T2V]|uniref:hypothetical protein n=1 Tax=Rhodococcus sp. T2V TaxID=3034164 RepID=UPI0023E128A5|nr:hypothetical protein [Rhodococcus sp. T2V]
MICEVAHGSFGVWRYLFLRFAYCRRDFVFFEVCDGVEFATEALMRFGEFLEECSVWVESFVMTTGVAAWSGFVVGADSGGNGAGDTPGVRSSLE